MKIEIKMKKQACTTNVNIVSINGIDEFCEHPRKENCWIYNGRMPYANCWVFINPNCIQILNVMVHNPQHRRSGIGKAMISEIRQAFPQSHIWVDTWNCSRPFWEKMKGEGYIDSIANDYSWPCTNTTCMVCHPFRNNIRRRIFQ